MSRSRPITTPHGDFWIDRKRDGDKATHDQLEVLAANLDLDMDDLLDEVWTQGDVVRKLREVTGRTPPEEVLDRMKAARVARQIMPACRCCGKTGDSTQHHFVNKWILRELQYYEPKWAKRTINCIPVCIDCHRDLHTRDGVHSIVDKLTSEEKAFAEAALTALAEERPKLLVLIARGERIVYEVQLVHDWLNGKFRSQGTSKSYEARTNERGREHATVARLVQLDDRRDRNRNGPDETTDQVSAQEVQHQVGTE